MDDIRITRDVPTGPVAMVKNALGFGVQRKGYNQIMQAFTTVKTDLDELVAANDADITVINEEIQKLEKEKAEVVEEKNKAAATLEFLSNMIK